jgi:nitrogen fixation/metabolism regulation signal transduction histidine kinase
MQPALAMAAEPNALEDLGRATLQIVHDLKNQLNGLKLYATFLRKRLEPEDRSPEERETLAKLIAGLDRAAKDMTVLVRYAQPVVLRRQPHVDLRKIIAGLAREVPAQHSASSQPARLAAEIESGPFHGEFDPAALSEALKLISEQLMSSASSREVSRLSLQVRRAGTQASPEALIEWQGAESYNRADPSHSLDSSGALWAALAAKIIKAHGGRVEFAGNAIRVWLPLSE